MTALGAFGNQGRAAYMPSPEVGGVNHDAAAELLQHGVRQHGTRPGQQEALALHPPQGQHNGRVLRRDAQHLMKESVNKRKLIIQGHKRVIWFCFFLIHSRSIHYTLYYINIDIQGITQTLLSRAPISNFVRRKTNTIYRWDSKDVHRTKSQALTIARL